MKFLCPQCKAKYRIADEKLEQRSSSKMKCRKCGHVIDIHSAAVPESMSPPAPGEDVSEDRESRAEVPAARNVPRVAPAAGGQPLRRAPAAAGKAAAPVAKVAAPAAKAAAPAPAKRVAVQAPKRPTAAAPPRRGRAVAVAEAVAEPPAGAEPASPAPPAELKDVEASPAAGIEPKSDAKTQPKNEFRNDFGEDEPTRIHDGGALSDAFSSDEPTRIHDGGALTAAFSQAVVEKIDAPPQQSIPDEWYVGIDGSPIGPLSLAQLREKASLRKATLDSLVWKDGFEEWKPLRDFPELASLVTEAQEAFAPDPKTVPAPSPLEEQAKAEARVPVHSSTSDVLEELGVKQRKQAVSHPVAWAGIVVALAFGVTIGIVLFSKTERQEVVKYVEVPASAKAEAPEETKAPEVIEGPTVSGGPSKRTGGSGAPKPETSAPVAKPSTGSGLLAGLNGIAGPAPASGGSDVAGGAAPGGQLDGASIQRVVANFSSSVRRGCWDPALAAKAPDAPSSARVGVTITIAPSGNVDNVTTTGDPKGYPSLSRCIESRVRGWRFPRSSGTTTAQVPFVFAAQ